MLRALLSSVGGRWTLRLYAGFNLIAGLPTALAVPRSQYAARSTIEGPERRNTHISRALFMRPTFLFSAVAAFLQVCAQAIFTLFSCWDGVSYSLEDLTPETSVLNLSLNSLHLSSSSITDPQPPSRLPAPSSPSPSSPPTPSSLASPHLKVVTFSPPAMLSTPCRAS